ncbi:MAG TPA: carboxypeptidase regulatory-like domain-containing protein [Thermoanaerobaculia bacterium]|nr:carboxypeptidase regulatory-like domain-containing protein [Thermoanaerobaculia bacterium]HQR66390.1 carboxypeptidase regulatory-like domain-containing protein [Thermoanaerobaculia bacterium]
MNRTRSLLAAAAAVLVLLLPAASALGQETSGSLQGIVTMKSDKSPIPGVTVEAVHVPTGTHYTAVTSSTGRFTILNVRVGSPYTVTAKIGGFRTETMKNIVITLGEKRYVTFELDIETKAESVTVTAQAQPLISPTRMGSDEAFTSDEIKSLPTIRRQFQDFARANPYVNVAANDSTQTNISVSGKNNRYNTIQIDGAVNNDLFGLSTTGTPGGQTDTQPISFEAIQELQVAVSPYDIKQSGFTGGAINMITRSGSNEFHGSAYGFTRDQSYIGKDVPQPYGPAKYQPVASFSQTQYGGSLGAPILKDRLFFFGSGERNESSVPTNGSADGSTVNSYPNTAQAAAFKALLTSKYNYDPGSLGDYNKPINSTLIFGRLDFNINDSNQATFRYNYVNAISGVNTQRDANAYGFETNGYNITDKTNSMVLQVNSVFGANSFNQGRVGYQTIRDSRAVPVQFPSVYICKTGFSTCTGNNTWDLAAGTERSSGANSLNQDILEVTDDYTLIKGDHTITIGTHNEFFKFENLFIQDVYGTYFFASVADFEKGTAQRYQVQFANGADPRRPTKFSAQQWGLYVGDQWRVSNSLNLNLGVRFDLPRLPDSPTYNPLVYSTFGVNTSDMPSNMLMFSPRLGFNWAPGTSGKDQVRGGIGVFAGRTPFVWISNVYGNTGVEISNLSASNVAFNPDPNNPPKNFPPGSSAITVNGIDTSFKFPSVLRTTLGYDRELPWGIHGTVEFMFTKTLKDIFYYNINRIPTGGTTFYGAPTYKKLSTAFNDMVYLSNTNRGEQQDLTVQLEKRFPFGLYLSGAYAYMNSKAGFEGTSSVAYSNWQFQTTNGDIYTPQLTRSFFEVPDRFTVVATQNLKTGPLTHNFGLVFTAMSGQPYSILMSGDPNGDGTANNDLIFVPKSYSDIVWKGAGAPTEDQWNTFLSTTGLDQFRGRTMPRNALDAPWIHTLDFHYDVTLPISVVNVQLSFEILNLINLIDHDKGLLRYVQNQTYVGVAYSGIDSATSKPIYTVSSGALAEGKQYTTQDVRSRYQLKWGARLTF